MKNSRRDFVKASAALAALSVTKTSALAATTKKIGFVVSTPYQASHMAAFMQALNDKGWEASAQKASVFWLSAGGKYGPMHYELKKLTKLHAGSNVDLIVAAGGLPAAVAVAKALQEASSNIPFVYLIGRWPASATGDDLDAADLFNSSNAVGGVDQAVPNQNQANFGLLKGKGVTIDTCGLIVNGNNPITRPEVTAWKALSDSGKNPNPNFIFTLTGENDMLSNFFASIANNPDIGNLTGMVVSSDAHLRSQGATFDKPLRAALKLAPQDKSAIWVCYPYKEYAFESTVNATSSGSTPALATEDPTDATTAYYQLGVKAAAVLTNPASPPGRTTWTWNAATGKGQWS